MQIQSSQESNNKSKKRKLNFSFKFNQFWTFPKYSKVQEIQDLHNSNKSSIIQKYFDKTSSYYYIQTKILSFLAITTLYLPYSVTHNDYTFVAFPLLLLIQLIILSSVYAGVYFLVKKRDNYQRKMRMFIMSLMEQLIYLTFSIYFQREDEIFGIQLNHKNLQLVIIGIIVNFFELVFNLIAFRVAFKDNKKQLRLKLIEQDLLNYLKDFDTNKTTNQVNTILPIKNQNPIPEKLEIKSNNSQQQILRKNISPNIYQDTLQIEEPILSKKSQSMKIEINNKLQEKKKESKIKNSDNESLQKLVIRRKFGESILNKFKRKQQLQYQNTSQINREGSNECDMKSFKLIQTQMNSSLK